ncbi:uncharacterized protein [Anabrus simplex]|uniref:uncharacterized protein n=1 Tax=Anabrus simplex TaxID=316456 RepID=UPI0035A333DE
MLNPMASRGSDRGIATAAYPASLHYCYTMGQQQQHQVVKQETDTNNNAGGLPAARQTMPLVGDVGMTLRQMTNECLVQPSVGIPPQRHQLPSLLESLVSKNMNSLGIAHKQTVSNLGISHKQTASMCLIPDNSLNLLNRQNILPSSSQCLVQTSVVGATDIPRDHLVNNNIVQRSMGEVKLSQRSVLGLGTVEDHSNLVQNSVISLDLGQRQLINEPSLVHSSVSDYRSLQEPSSCDSTGFLSQSPATQICVDSKISPLVSEEESLSSHDGLVQGTEGVSSKMGEVSQQTGSALTDSNNNSSNNAEGDVVSVEKTEEISAPPRKSDKYSLRPRSIQKRLETEQRGRQVAESKSSRRGGGNKSSSGARPKQKPPPLSKYRRKTANARERDRMREINAAFESLRRAVPHLSDACNGNEKLTKITTLRLAMKYIAALSQALKTPEPELGPLSDLDCLFLGSDTESLAMHSDLSEHCLTPHSLQDLDDTDLCHPCLGDTGQAFTPPDSRNPFTPPDSGHPFTPPELEDLFS